MPEIAATDATGKSPDQADPAGVVSQVRALLEAHYVFPDIAEAVSGVLAEGLAAGRYPPDAAELAAVVTADLQSANGDKHLRLQYHDEALPVRAPGDDAGQVTSLAKWADRVCGGVACVQRLAGNVGYLDLQPILFPAAICGEIITAAMSLVARTDALILDLRHCGGGEPGMAVFVASYLWDGDPVQLTGLRERQDFTPRQMWTLPHVPGRRFGKTKPVYLLTSAATFSGGEQLAYDLQQLGRTAVVGERTRGGAHPREAFPVHAHLQATIPVAESVNPVTGGNWEGTGVTPDVEVSASQARDTAYRLALQAVMAAGTLGRRGQQRTRVNIARRERYRSPSACCLSRTQQARAPRNSDSSPPHRRSEGGSAVPAISGIGERAGSQDTGGYSEELVAWHPGESGALADYVL